MDIKFDPHTWPAQRTPLAPTVQGPLGQRSPAPRVVSADVAPRPGLSGLGHAYGVTTPPGPPLAAQAAVTRGDSPIWPPTASARPAMPPAAPAPSAAPAFALPHPPEPPTATRTWDWRHTAPAGMHGPISEFISELGASAAAVAPGMTTTAHPPLPTSYSHMYGGSPWAQPRSTPSAAHAVQIWPQAPLAYSAAPGAGRPAGAIKTPASAINTPASAINTPAGAINTTHPMRPHRVPTYRPSPAISPPRYTTQRWNSPGGAGADAQVAVHQADSEWGQQLHPHGPIGVHSGPASHGAYHRHAPGRAGNRVVKRPPPQQQEQRRQRETGEERARQLEGQVVAMALDQVRAQVPLASVDTLTSLTVVLPVAAPLPITTETR